MAETPTTLPIRKRGFTGRLPRAAAAVGSLSVGTVALFTEIILRGTTSLPMDSRPLRIRRGSEMNPIHDNLWPFYALILGIILFFSLYFSGIVLVKVI